MTVPEIATNGNEGAATLVTVCMIKLDSIEGSFFFHLKTIFIIYVFCGCAYHSAALSCRCSWILCVPLHGVYVFHILCVACILLSLYTTGKTAAGTQQLEFMPGKETTDAILVMSQIQNLWETDVTHDLCRPGNSLWCCATAGSVDIHEREVDLRKLWLIEDMNEQTRTRAKSCVEMEEEFPLKRKLIQWSSLRPDAFNFISVLRREITGEAPWVKFWKLYLLMDTSREGGKKLETGKGNRG